MQRFILNPILSKEFRSRMRSWKSPLVISLYLGTLALITIAYYWVKQKNMMYSGFGPNVGPEIYVVLTVFQLLLVSFVTPAFTAGVINGERERQTFDLLTCTPLSATSIVLNKLFASISYIFLLIIASLPAFGVVYFFGGVLLSEIVQVFIIYLVTALTFGTIGIFCSAIFKRTQVSMVVSYIIVFIFLIGTLLVTVFLQGMHSGAYPVGQRTVPLIIYLNPLIALFSIFPAYGIPYFVSDIIQQIFYRNGMAAAGIQTIAPWQYNFIINGIIVIILLVATIILIDPVGRFSRFKSKRAKQEQKVEDSKDEQVGISG